MEENHIPKPGEDKPLYIIGAVMTAVTFLGTHIKAWNMGRAYGIREERKRIADQKGNSR